MKNYYVVDIEIEQASITVKQDINAVKERSTDKRHDQDYRYLISYEKENKSDNIITVIMIKPGYGSIFEEDQTIEILLKYFMKENKQNYSKLNIVNLFAHVSNKSYEFNNINDKYEHINKTIIKKVIEESHEILIAWGHDKKRIKKHVDKIAEVEELIDFKNQTVSCYNRNNILAHI